MKISFKPESRKLTLSLIALAFVLLVIPITVYTTLKLEETNRTPKASTPISGFTEQQIVGGLTQATAMEFAPDGRIFVLEQAGNVRVVKNNILLATPYLQIPSTDSYDERGVLGIAFDPNWNTNKWVYIYHTITSPASHNRVSRYTQNATNPDSADLSSEVVILDLENLSSAGNHNGGAIHFGSDGKLYVGVGENANKPNAQSLSNRLGKLLRINSDGTIPADNPTSFPAITGTTSGVNKAIWSVGLRNPFTFAVQPSSGKIYINNVGSNPPPDTPNPAGPIEEINQGASGANFGWPNAEGTQSCSTYTCPVYDYDHSQGCAITGGAFYNPSTVAYPSSYVGNYLFADYCGGWIRRIDPANPSNVLGFTTGIQSPVDVKVGSDGNVYYLARTSNSGAVGGIFKILYSTPTHPTPASGSTNIYCEGESASPLTAPMVKGTDTAISQDYVFTSATDTTSTTLPTTTGTAEYNFDVPTSGTYTFWARVNYPDASSNSYWIQFDSQAPMNKLGNDNNFNNWHWINFTDGDTTAVNIRVSLTAGTHKIKIAGREPNAKLDRWILSTDSLYAPLDSDRGGAANCALSANQPPTGSILTPVSGTTYTHGQTIAFSGSGIDPEDGTLPASAYTWNIEFGHSTHFHPHQTFTGLKSGSFIANFAESADNVYYRVNLILTDSGGKQFTTYRDVLPIKSTTTLTSSPTGLQLKLDGGAVVAPFQFIGIVGYPRSIEAPTPQTLNSLSYTFLNWSDLGTAIHTISTPATNTTFTASYQQQTAKLGDINGDNQVNSSDLAIVLSTWGSVTDLRADLNKDGKVTAADLAVLLSRWGS